MGECRKMDDDDESPHEIDGESDGCYRCGGRHWEVVCCDDLCRGSGECMHGDGMAPCPECNKDGVLEENY
jgi:hypothetical protein